MSKFDGIVEARLKSAPDAADVAEQEQPRRKQPESTRVTQKPPTNSRVASPERRGPGRPPGKRSDPEFIQTTAHIRRDTHREVKIALLREGQGREFSELVEHLLFGWLKRQQSK